MCDETDNAYDPEGRCALRDHDEILREKPEAATSLGDALGIHTRHFWTDTMHDDYLDIRKHLVGSAMWHFIGLGVWGSVPG